MFISHSAKRDPLTLAVLRRVTGGLAERNFGVRVDMDALRPGEDWCATLYQWLAECDAAVVFFNEAALESFWVRREVNILLWRRALNPRFRVVPVLMGSMTSGRLRDAGFTDVLPVEFAREAPPPAPDPEPEAAPYTETEPETETETESNPEPEPEPEPASDTDPEPDGPWDGAVTADPGGAGEPDCPAAVREAYVERLAGAVLGRFPTRPDLSAVADPMRGWIARIADQLQQTRSDRPLLAAARTLGIREDELPDVRADTGACLLLAHRMLGTVEGAVLKSALMELSAVLSSDQLDRLVTQLLPIWVNGESARHILPPPGGPPSRAVVLNASQQTTAGHFVDRAMCLQLDRYHVGSAGGMPMGEDAAGELTDECVDAVRALLHYPPGVPPERFRPREGVLHCLSVDVSALRPAVVERAVGEVRRRFPWLVVILLTGETVPDERTLRDWRIDGLVVVTPHLAEDEEILGYQLTEDLRELPRRLNGSWR
ncbi:toll/interleukin-1 receptor domain-containing protein [Streptomyces yaizuensis]|uniref:Toll/interleukin-1 receptor domain-containing protein n=1 Tax=Streptomyces yaizuensis TaxID=2989713 RepID=A0ABQ5NYZ1_9ACTN|nr:toll/interleukin-1 receptor domain-containing protein [Streptomyces sp. YSPA8]GLF95420.1 toll/interleukin-1 receptor domain-containing protein [Streptomyces sp. YSPA8]